MIDFDKISPTFGSFLFLYTFGILGNGCLNIFLFDKLLFVQLDIYKIILIAAAITFPAFIFSFIFFSNRALIYSNTIDLTDISFYSSSATSLFLMALTAIKVFNIDMGVERMLLIYICLLVASYFMGFVYLAYKKRKKESCQKQDNTGKIQSI